MKNVFYDVMPCSLVQIYRCSGFKVEFTRKTGEAHSIARSVHFNMDSFIVKTEPAGFKHIGEFTPDYARLHFTQQNSSRDQI